MDMYGHNPFTARSPELLRPLIKRGKGYADFSDLDAVWGWLDRYGYRDRRGRPLRIFISEWTLPTDHPNAEFNFYVTRTVQATWLRVALRIVRREPRLYSLGWHALVDDAPRSDRLETNRGLIDHRWRRKPAFYVFRRG